MAKSAIFFSRNMLICLLLHVNDLQSVFNVLMVKNGSVAAFNSEVH